MRDVSYIIANMRDCDKAEIYCQIPKDIKASEYAYSLLHSMECYVATYRGNPALVFGVSPMVTAVLSAWAFGTKEMTRCIPAATRFLKSRKADWIAQGYHRMEARTLSTHKQAHRWLESTGAKRVCSLPEWGSDGELFYLYVWRSKDVCHAKSAKASACAKNASSKH